MSYENAVVKDQYTAELASQEKTAKLLWEERRKASEAKKLNEKMERFKGLSKQF